VEGVVLELDRTTSNGIVEWGAELGFEATNPFGAMCFAPVLIFFGVSWKGKMTFEKFSLPHL
jgi:hypothetical protein